MRLAGGKNNVNHMSAQMTDTFNNSCNVGLNNGENVASARLQINWVIPYDIWVPVAVKLVANCFTPFTCTVTFTFTPLPLYSFKARYNLVCVESAVKPKPTDQSTWNVTCLKSELSNDNKSGYLKTAHFSSEAV